MGTESTSLRTFVGSVVCIDLVGYSKLPVDRQIEVKKRFNARLMKALAPVPAKDRVMLDTGDGVLVGFLADPEQCFATTLKIREVIDPGSARIGIHLGSVKLIPGLSGDVRLVGDTASIAERIASLAEPGQIVVSRSFHAMVSRLSGAHEALFRPPEIRMDKQGQAHEVSVVDPPPRRPVNKALVAGIAGVVVVAVGAAIAWILVHRGKDASSPPPVLAQQRESTAPAQAPPQAAPPQAAPPRAEAPKPAPVETRKAPAARSESPPRAEPRPVESRAEPRPQASAPSSSSTATHLLNQGQKLLTTLGTGTMDAARTAGTTAGHVFSTVKEKTLGVSSPPAPPPRVVSRAATYFPQEAASQGVRYGKVRARLDIDAAGDVTHVTILSADPAGYFESEATRSLKRWKFDGGADGRTYETDLDFRR